MPPHPPRPFLGLLLLSSLILAACGRGADEGEPVRPAMVVQPVPAGAAYEAFAGEVRARHEPALAFRIGGKIARRHVEVGDRVRAGQPLAELDPQDVRLQVEVAQAQLAAAEADEALARAERERYRAMLERQLISASAFDARENAWRAAAARVEQVRAQREVARNQADYAVLTATADGVIAQRFAEAGQVVATGQSVFVLAEDGEREVAIALPEQSVGEFRIGQPVSVELWSQPGRRLPGRLREVAPAADPQARTFAARVSLLEKSPAVELGQSARVYLANGDSGRLSLPLSAVTAEEGAAYVWRIDPQNQRLQRRDVRVAAFREDQVEIVEGLAAGDWIVAAGVHLLREGQAVRPVDRDNRPVSLAQPE